MVQVITTNYPLCKIRKLGNSRKSDFVRTETRVETHFLYWFITQSLFEYYSSKLEFPPISTSIGLNNHPKTSYKHPHTLSYPTNSTHPRIEDPKDRILPFHGIFTSFSSQIP